VAKAVLQLSEVELKSSNCRRSQHDKASSACFIGAYRIWFRRTQAHGNPPRPVPSSLRSVTASVSPSVVSTAQRGTQKRSVGSRSRSPRIARRRRSRPHSPGAPARRHRPSHTPRTDRPLSAQAITVNVGEVDPASPSNSATSPIDRLGVCRRRLVVPSVPPVALSRSRWNFVRDPPRRSASPAGYPGTTTATSARRVLPQPS
jgi:hypothetical protein